MASVNFEKLKTPQQVKAMLRHCDGEERMEANHSNIDIDKSKTSGNMQGIWIIPPHAKNIANGLPFWTQSRVQTNGKTG